METGPRGPRDDFFCWKFEVWYNLNDCCFRHHFATHPVCADCDQGAQNLRLSRRIPTRPRWSELPRGFNGELDLDEEAL